MADAVIRRIPAHQDSDPDFNAKARHYKTAYFADHAHELLEQQFPREAVCVVYIAEQYNVMYGVHEPVFAAYRTMSADTLIGTYFARALKDFVL